MADQPILKDATDEASENAKRRRTQAAGAVARGTLLAAAGAASLAAGWTYAVGPSQALRSLSSLGLHESGDAVEATAYVELDEIVANLSTGRTPSFVRATLVLQVPGEKRADVEKLKPQLLDSMQEFIRQQRPADLQGGAGFYRFKTECLYRLRLMAGAENIEDVHVTNLMTQ